MSIDLTLDEILIPNLVGYTQPFGTKVVQTEQNLGGLSTAEVNANILMAFSKMRPVPIASTTDTTAIEYDAKLVFQSTLESTVQLTLGSGTYIGCTVRVSNASAHSQEVRNIIGSNGFIDTLDVGAYGEYMWNGSTWIKCLTKVSVAQPTTLTTGDIWVEVDPQEIPENTTGV